MLFPVASPNNPPNVMIGVKHAKYKKKIEATDWRAKASLKSLIYHGSFRFKSLARPPNNLLDNKETKSIFQKAVAKRIFYRPVLRKPHCSLSRSSSSSSLNTFPVVTSFGSCFFRDSWDGTWFGGSIRILGSHAPGGRIVTASKNSSTPANKSSRHFDL